MLDRLPGWVGPTIVFITAMVFRIWFLLQFSNTPLFDTDIMDMAYFHRLATVGIPGSGFPSGSFFKAPLYPLFLKLVFGLFGDGSWPIRIIQILMGSLTAVGTWLITARLAGRRAALIAGFIIAAYGPLILYDGQLLAPTLAIFLNTAAIYIIILALRYQRAWLYSAAGLVLGLSAVVRPTVLVFALGAAVIVYLYSQEKRNLRKGLLLLVGLIVAIVPVTIRNWSQSGEFVLIGSYSGINLYIGNNLKADGVSTTIPGTGLDWWDNASMSDTRAMAETDAGRPLSAAEESNYWRNRAIHEMINHPGVFTRLVIRKLVLTLGGYELANNFDIYYLARRIPPLNVLIWRRPVFFPFGLLLPFGLAGICLIRRWETGFLLLAWFLVAALPTLLLFFVTARYRLPLVPVLAVFTATGIDQLLSGFTKLPRKRIWTAGLVLLVFLILGRWDPYGYASGSEAQGHQMFAAIYRHQGNNDQAERYYRLALQSDPSLPHANNDLGLLLQERGDYEQALVLHERAVRAQPDDWILRYNYGLALKGLGRFDEALPCLSEAVAASPGFFEAVNELAFTLLQAGYVDSAGTVYRQATTLDQNNAGVWFALGLCYHLMDQRDSAEAVYRQALVVDPDYGKACYNLGRLFVENGQLDSAGVYLDRYIKMTPDGDNLRRAALQLLDSLGRSGR